jgi:hypothetical protein
LVATNAVARVTHVKHTNETAEKEILEKYGNCLSLGNTEELKVRLFLSITMMMIVCLFYPRNDLTVIKYQAGIAMIDSEHPAQCSFSTEIPRTHPVCRCLMTRTARSDDDKNTSPARSTRRISRMQALKPSPFRIRPVRP